MSAGNTALERHSRNTTSLSPSTGGEPVTDVFWPQLRGKLRSTPDAFGRLELECSICRKLMVLDTVAARGKGEADNTHVCIGVDILICGHIFGHSCIEHWLVGMGTGNLRCPTCRYVLLTEGCRNPIESYRFTCIHDACRVPKTIYEGGERPMFCAVCCAKPALDKLKHWISFHLKRHACIEDMVLTRIAFAWGPPPIGHQFFPRYPDILAETSMEYWLGEDSIYSRYRNCANYIQDINPRGADYSLDDSDDGILPCPDSTNSPPAEDEENLRKQEETSSFGPPRDWVPPIVAPELAVHFRSDETDSARQEMSEFYDTLIRKAHEWRACGCRRQQI